MLEATIVSFPRNFRQFRDHRELTEELLIKWPPAGPEQERANAEAIRQTEIEKQAVPEDKKLDFNLLTGAPEATGNGPELR